MPIFSIGHIGIKPPDVAPGEKRSPRKKKRKSKKSSLTRAGEQRHAPAETSGGWVCTKCKTANRDGQDLCGFCDTPRFGG